MVKQILSCIATILALVILISFCLDIYYEGKEDQIYYQVALIVVNWILLFLVFVIFIISLFVYMKYI